jgi:hypothetical protein
VGTPYDRILFKVIENDAVMIFYCIGKYLWPEDKWKSRIQDYRFDMTEKERNTERDISNKKNGKVNYTKNL